MSGKKASEVNQLLNSGKNIRSGSMNILKTEFDKVESTMSSFSECISEAKKKCSSHITTGTAEKEFPEAAKKLNSDYQRVINALNEIINGNDELQSLSTEYQSLLRSYQQVDDEAERISGDLKKKIKSQSHSDAWYCDEEFNRANTVANKYKGLKTQVNSLVSRLASAHNASTRKTSEVREYSKQLDAIAAQASDLESKAKATVQLRADAAQARSSVKQDFAKIDSAIAQKFMKTEYESLKKSVETFVGKSDEEVVSSINSQISAIKQFSAELDDRYAEFRRHKSSTEAALSCAKGRVSKKDFDDPKSEFSDQELDKYTLTEFLSTFCQGQYVAEISGKLKEAERLFKNEAFSEADIVLRETEALIDSAITCAVNEHECRIKTIESMLKMEGAMCGLNYDVCVNEVVGDDGGFGGYEIVCDAGDERIVFEDVVVDENGELTFGIDHTESTKGTCGSSWDAIRKSMAENEIFLEDVTKNGVSVHAPNNQAKRANSSKPAADRSHK